MAAPAVTPTNVAFEQVTHRLRELQRQPMRQAFLARALNALVRLTPALAERELSQAVAAPSDLEVLLRALESPEALAALLPDDPLVAARLRGLRARDALLQAEGGTMSAEQVSEILGISRQAVDKRRRAGRLIGLDTGRRGYAYPAWQLHGHGLLPGLGAVLTALASHDSWMQAAFFLESNPYLDDKSPLAQLRNGAIEAVIHAARASGEHGAA